MYLVDEEDGTVLGKDTVLLRTLDNLAHILNTRSHGIERIEGHFKTVGNDVGQRGLTRSRGAPENKRGYSPRLYHAAHHSIFAYEMFLSYIIIKRRRTQAFSQWFHYSVIEGYFLSYPYNILTHLRNALQQEAYDSYTYKGCNGREDNLQRGCPEAEHTLGTQAKPTAKITADGHEQQ